MILSQSCLAMTAAETTREELEAADQSVKWMSDKIGESLNEAYSW